MSIGTTVESIAALFRTGVWGRERSDAFRGRRLSQMVRHAYENVPYYRRLFDRHGLRPDHVQSLADLDRIPLTSKADLQAQPVADTLAAGSSPQNLIARWTEGSTGAPFTIRWTLFEELLLNVFRLRALRWAGMKFRDRRLFVMDSLDSGVGPDQTRQRLLLPFHLWGFFPCRVVSGGRPVTQLAEILRRDNPEVLGGYPSYLGKLAEYLDANASGCKSPRFVATGGEVLTPDLRLQIEKTFGAPVYDSYGANEFNLVAYECPRTGAMHIMNDAVILEVLKDGRPAAAGERGEVVVTALHSFAMPFIRYRLEDSVIQGMQTCDCGASVSTIRSILGRTSEYFALPEGRAIHPYDFVNAVWGEPWILRLQVVQERLDRIVLRLVPREKPAAPRLAALQRKLEALTGSGVEVEVSLLSEIPQSPRGKFRVYHSLVDGSGPSSPHS